MIKVIDINHRAHLFNIAVVSQVIEAGNSGKWHGINCYVKLLDGTTIEARESVDQVLQMLAAAPEAKP